MTKYCPDSPADLGLPKDSWWPGQQETIDLILTAFLDHGKKYVIAAIPTGGGKTITASAVQKLLARGAGQYGAKSLVLTHTIQLQKQYQDTLEEAAVLTGRGNHLCALAEDSIYRLGTSWENPLTAEDAPCTEGKCPEDKKQKDAGCSYYDQWWEAAEADMVITNYAYASRVLPLSFQDGGNPFRRELLIADECHLAESAVQQAAGIKLWMGPITKAGLRVPGLETRIEVEVGSANRPQKKLYENVIVWKLWATEATNKLLPKLTEATKAWKAKLDKNDTSGAKEARAKWKSLKTLHDALRDLASIPKPEEWIIRRDYNLQRNVISITAQPLFGWSAAQDLLFKHSEKVLLMSATPGDPVVSRVTLGLPFNEVEYIERPSTFPRENRPVYFWNVAKLNYSSSDSDWDKVAKAIGWIATRQENLSRKGLVHSGSAQNAKKLVTMINKYLPGRAFTHAEGGMTREAALAEFQLSDKPRIFVTASFTTGLDLPYLIGWQVIAKVPFGSLGDEITARRKEFKLPNGDAFGQQVYIAECANTVVQAAGRIVRAPDDSGPTYILDGAWEMIRRTAYLPQFFLDAYSKFTVE